ncbi:MAG: Mrp/NBP35 family ATP-binding protein [Selenomonadaceae bacterium]|nr:Mrp/NBP35 family ATP-binding protein [Selenomonadaceae bacterium]
MSESCNNDCASCGENCGERTMPQDLLAPLNQNSNVGKVIAVMSGKGGVGKSMVTSLLASAAKRAGKKVAVMDADITGPSIPQGFGLTEHLTGSETELYPADTRTGIKVVSMNLMLQETTDPVIWRGPILAGVVKQFWTDVLWGDIDVMFVDMPPGTGDVPLTVLQSLPVDGIVVVTSPQEMVGMIVEKAVKMAKMMEIPVFALVENMSYFKCPDCGKNHDIFGKSHAKDVADKYDIKEVSRLPMDPAYAAAADAGEIEFLQEEGLKNIVESIEKL